LWCSDNSGDTAALQAFVSPANATIYGYAWVSSDETVATVDQYGNVTTVGSGVANITATTVEGAFVAACEVTVMFIENPVASISISKTRRSCLLEIACSFLPKQALPEHP
jgi:uncharacterized protein YjdB